MTRHFQAAENRRLEEALKAKVPFPVAPSGKESKAHRRSGSLVGRIEIPRLKLSAVVLEGSDNSVLDLGVGRIPETSEPGEAGNVVLGGHRDTFFRPLSGIRGGDSINIVTPEGSYKYTVDWMRVVDPDDTAVLKATPERSLTLVTCYPFHFVGPAPRRFIVRAHQSDNTSTAVATSDPDSRRLPRVFRKRVQPVATRRRHTRSRASGAHRYTAR